MNLKKHVPMLKISTKKGTFFAQASQRKDIEKQWQEKKFIILNGKTIATRDIETIEDHNGDIDKLKLSIEEDQQLDARKKLFYSRIGRYPNTRELDTIKRKMFPAQMMDQPFPKKEETHYFCDFGTVHEVTEDCVCQCATYFGCGVGKFWLVLRKSYPEVRYNDDITEQMQMIIKSKIKD